MESNSLSGSTGLGARDRQPLFKHDCNLCAFLGTMSCWRDGVLEFFDLYYHAGEGPGETVIARYGSDGEYYSGMHFAAPYTDITGAKQPGIPMLVEAKRRAAASGLIGAKS